MFKIQAEDVFCQNLILLKKKKIFNSKIWTKKTNREAEEKAAEIRSKADEEFAIEKARLVTEEKLKITKEFERKEKQIDVKKKM